MSSISKPGQPEPTRQSKRHDHYLSVTTDVDWGSTVCQIAWDFLLLAERNKADDPA